MKVLYITRHFNHSGYLILDRLLKENINIVGVLLKDEFSFYKVPCVRRIFIFIYKLKCKYYRCRPLKATNSEELLARKSGKKIIKTKSIKSDIFFRKLESLGPDIIVLGGGWPELIPRRIFSFPKLGCINTHPSLLPEFKGTSITRWQVLNMVEKSGTTIHYVDENFDTGGVLAQQNIEVEKDTTPQELFFKLGELGANLMPLLLRKFEKEGKQTAINAEHNPKYYNYYGKWKFSVDKLLIDWSRSFPVIHHFVLANTQESYEYLGPIFKFNKKQFFLRRTKLHAIDDFFADVKKIEPQKGQIIVIKNSDESIFLYREDEKYILELKQIQLFDRFYKLRRAKAAPSFIILKKGNIFNCK